MGDNHVLRHVLRYIKVWQTLVFEVTGLNLPERWLTFSSMQVDVHRLHGAVFALHVLSLQLQIPYNPLYDECLSWVQPGLLGEPNVSSAHTLLSESIATANALEKEGAVMPSLPVVQPGSQGSYVRLVQMNLNGLALNYNEFPINGVFETKTEDAVKNFQDRFDIPRTGIVDAATWKLLTSNVQAIQRLLNGRGFPVGTPDGYFGPQTTNAVIAFQRSNGLYPSGIVEPRTRQRLFDPYPKDNFPSRPTSTDLRSLNPYVATLAQKFLRLTAENGLDVRITTAFRSWDDEDRLFAQGRWAPGQIVTNARGGDSYHNWGLAFDAAPYENGQVTTDNEKFLRMGQLGQEVGLQWGGSFKALVDLPHFQYTFGLGTWDLLNGVRPPVRTR